LKGLPELQVLSHPASCQAIPRPDTQGVQGMTSSSCVKIDAEDLKRKGVKSRLGSPPSFVPGSRAFRLSLSSGIMPNHSWAKYLRCSDDDLLESPRTWHSRSGVHDGIIVHWDRFFNLRIETPRHKDTTSSDAVRTAVPWNRIDRGVKASTDAVRMPWACSPHPTGAFHDQFLGAFKSWRLISS